ncbi:MAG: phage holin family protein [Tannerella sp.]|jgi:hypothetical protein|nr:phage holin family protein [Tannerella sp.]
MIKFNIFDGIGTMLIIFCVEVFIVIGAMIIDFASGIHKAKLSGEIRSSYGLKRTMSKFILYVGGLCIACGIDSIFFVSQLWGLIGLSLLTKIPVVSTLVAIFSCVIEFRSVWEKAEDKHRKKAGETLDLLLSMVDKQTLIKSLSESLASAGKHENKYTHGKHK